MTGRLAGKVALVTGGARGQGAATVRRFVAEGARVTAADILDDDGRALAGELGDAAKFVHLDVTDEGEWARAVDATLEAFDRLDVLVNNAGILLMTPLETLSLAEFRKVLDVNLTGVFLGMRAVIPALKAAGGGSIVNISSVEGFGGSAGCGAYTASKFAVRGITKVAALELGGDGIRVNSVHPGSIDTRMMRDVGVDDAGMAWVGKRVAGLRRVGQPEEVVAMSLFLASDESSYCTGAEFLVDGGATAHAGFG
ncbi:MAG: glucose 1-dehydrogenase [Mycobacteriales bacterium]